MAKSLQALVNDRQGQRPGGIPRAASCAIRRVGFLPKKNLFIVQGQFNSLSPGEQAYYRTLIQFDVAFSNTWKRNRPLRVEVFKDQWMYMEVPRYGSTTVRVTCTCPDYFWTWWWYTANKAGSHSGIDLPYPSEITGSQFRKTDGKRYGTVPGSRNDAKTPGICKHIYHLAETLRGMKKLV